MKKGSKVGKTGAMNVRSPTTARAPPPKCASDSSVGYSFDSFVVPRSVSYRSTHTESVMSINAAAKRKVGQKSRRGS